MMAEDSAPKYLVAYDGLEVTTPPAPFNQNHLADMDEGKHVVGSDEGKHLVPFQYLDEAPMSTTTATPYPYHYSNGNNKPTSPSKRRRLYLIVGFVVVGIVVILAAVLGGYFGSRKSGKSDSSVSPTPVPGNSTNSSEKTLPHPINSTSLASTIAADSNNLLLYYQCENSSIVEVVYNASTFGSDESSPTSWSVLPAEAAAPDEQTALAATAWIDPDTAEAIRILFFTKDRYVVQTNATGTSWKNNSTISSLPIQSRALAACADVEHMAGVRFYSGSANGSIDENQYNFATFGPWKQTGLFANSDPKASVACTVQKDDSTDASYANIYYRDTVNGTLAQDWWLYTQPGFVWKHNYSPYTLPTGSSFAAIFDKRNIDTVVVASSNGTMSTQDTSPHAEEWLQSGKVLQADTDTASVAAWYVSGIGVVWMYQDDEGSILAKSVDGKFNKTIVDNACQGQNRGECTN